MKLKVLLVTMLALVSFVAAGCGLAQNMMGGGSSGTVSQLWSDVPQLPNSTKVDIGLPLPINIVVQGFIQAANADTSSGTKLDKFDFIAYQTPDSTEAVTSFYDTAKMQALGWNLQDTPGCTGASPESGGMGGFCAFGRQGDAGKSTILLIIPAPGESGQQTQVYYVRIEGTQTTQ